ncbi:MAG: nuclear transport factor 2 family protein [Novosphingobium sp.]
MKEIAVNGCRECDHLSMRSRIAEALANYCHYFDGGDYDGLRGIFVNAASIELGQSFSGSLDEFVLWAAEQRRLGKQYSHHVTNMVVEENGSGGAVSSISAVSALVASDDAETPARLVHGIYTDSWVRSGSCWRIKTRAYRPRITANLLG